MNRIRTLMGFVAVAALLAGLQAARAADAPEKKEAWIPLVTGNSLDGWTTHGSAKWRLENGVIVGESPGGQGHLYAAPVVSNLEVKGVFRVSSQGRDANSGLYFRANPPADNPEGFPNGYEAQICNSQKAFTGWLWKPGKPTGEASKLLTKDGEWFSMKVRAIGEDITIWVNDVEVTHYKDADYKTGQFALQCHNDKMKIEAKDLFYRNLDKP